MPESTPPPAASAVPELLDGPHGGFLLAILRECLCPACIDYRIGFRNRPRSALATRHPEWFSCGNPEYADYVLLEKAQEGRLVRVSHPDDRAGVIELVATGELDERTACQALLCTPEWLRSMLPIKG